MKVDILLTFQKFVEEKGKLVKAISGDTAIYNTTGF